MKEPLVTRTPLRWSLVLLGLAVLALSEEVGAQEHCSMREGPGRSATMSCGDGTRATIRSTDREVVLQTNRGDRVRGIKVGEDWLLSNQRGALGRVRNSDGPRPTFTDREGNTVRLEGRPLDGRTIERGRESTTRIEYRGAGRRDASSAPSWTSRVPTLPYRVLAQPERRRRP